MADIAMKSTFNDVLTAREWRGRRYLISPAADMLMVGGLGLLLMALMALLLPHYVRNEVTARTYSSLLAFVVTYHIFAINYPHFAFSYQIAYTRLRRLRADSVLPKTLRMRYEFALIGFPLLFLSYCYYGLQVQQPNGLFMLGLLINFMYLTVGWHYCKQCFGILMVLSALKGIYFNAQERRIFLMHALLIWGVTWLRGNITAVQHQFWGLPYKSFGLDQWIDMSVLKAIATLGTEAIYLLGIYSLILLFRSAKRCGTRLSLTATLGYFMMYPLLLISGYFHPLWLWILPAAHSLQYLLFVLAYRRNQQAQSDSVLNDAQHKPILSWQRQGIALFIAGGIALGALQFSWLPHALDALIAPEHKYHIPLMLLALCHLFVNIHHYFIDNVIWRRENPEVGQYLLARG